jgi:hypothetical protein
MPVPVAACLLRLWVRIPSGAWMFLCCECCVLSGRGLCDGVITRPEESYQLWHVVCDQEASKNEEAKAHYWAVKIHTQWVVTPGKQTNIYILQWKPEQETVVENFFTFNITVHIFFSPVCS